MRMIRFMLIMLSHIRFPIAQDQLKKRMASSPVRQVQMPIGW
jgi:hypothetical protein